jgi:adenosine deaminase
MRRMKSSSSKFASLIGALALMLFSSLPGNAQSVKANPGKTAEERSARFFESVRKSPPQMLAFLLKMPKGGDLHSHLSGAVYAESYIDWAAKKELCVNQVTMTLLPPSPSPCDQAAGQLPVSAALSNPVLYRKLIDGWSMRYWQYAGQNAHDQFFDSFGKFGVATWGQTGAMLAEVTSRAARGHVTYLELMLTPDEGKSSDIGKQVGWDGNFQNTLSKLKNNGIEEAAAIGVKKLQDAEAEKDRLLKCGTAQADPGCSLTIRYVAQVSRGAALGPV